MKKHFLFTLSASRGERICVIIYKYKFAERGKTEVVFAGMKKYMHGVVIG